MILLPTVFSTFQEISEKSLSEMLGRSAVLRLEAFGSSVELVGENLLAFLDEDPFVREFLNLGFYSKMKIGSFEQFY